MAESVEIVDEAGKRSKKISIIAMLVLLLAYFLQSANKFEPVTADLAFIRWYSDKGCFVLPVMRS